MLQTAGLYRRPLVLLPVAAPGWIALGVVRAQMPAVRRWRAILNPCPNPGSLPVEHPWSN